MSRTNSLRTRMVGLAMALALLAPVSFAQTKVESGFNMFSPEQDVEIGRQSAAQAEQQLPIVNNARVNDFVNRIGERLAAQASGPKFDYRFRVVNASDLNAFALPGGYIYLNRGIIESSRNEGEVAGVLAHEIAHVALRHGTHNASKAYMTQAGLSILGGLLGGKLGGGQNTAQIINALGGFGLNVLFLKYTREAEKNADILGAQILARAGYNPQDMINFFETLSKSDKRKGGPAWLQSHPSPEDRMGRIQKEARLLGVTPQATTRTSDLNAIQSTLRNLGTAPTSQQIASGRAPSTSRPSGTGTASTVRVPAPGRVSRTYTSRSRLFQVRYPDNWQVYETGPNGVTITPENGVVEASGRTEVVYGSILNHYEPFQNDTNRRRYDTTPEEATSDLVDQISRGSGYLKLVRGSTKRINLPQGGSALTATLTGTSPLTGLKERVTILARSLDDEHLVYMLFITPDRDSQAFSQVFNEMAGSLRVDETHRH